MERNGYPLQNIWEGYYNYILGANAALDYIGDVNGTEAEKNYVICFYPVWDKQNRLTFLAKHLHLWERTHFEI